MFIPRVVPFFVAALFVGSAVARTPGSGAVEAVAAKRAEADAFAILSTLDVEVATTLASIDVLVSTNAVTQASVAPLLEELNAKLTVASTTLLSVANGGILGGVARRQPDIELASLAAGIITKVTTTCSTLVPLFSSIPVLQSLTSTVQIKLNSVLTNLNVVVSGIMTTVAPLLSPVTGLLQGLGWSLISSLLGGLLPILPL